MPNRQESFRFATDILRRLGEELNPGPEHSLIELVKNAFDADALECKIELGDTTVSVSDDGRGMTSDEIREGWLVLGRSGKDQRTRTELGRIPAGNKGLGRLAALRMGHTVQLRTRPEEEPGRVYQVAIDWDEFDQEDMVDAVPINIEVRRTKRSSGTEILIEKLRRSLSRNEVKRFARSLILLADPFGDTPGGFAPVLNSAHYADLNELVARRYFDHSDYYLRGEVTADGWASAVVQDYRGEVVFSADHPDLRRSESEGAYRIGSLTFELWIFVLDAQSFSAKPVTIAEVREWLAEFGGVHFYLNGIRVEPYGNPGNDWLDMNLQRARSPELRPSTNTAIGRVAITDVDALLPQKTDRSGFVESSEFSDIRLFCQDCLDWLARRRTAERDNRRREQRRREERASQKRRAGVEQQLEKLPGPAKRAIESEFKKYEKSRDREAASLREDLQLYRTLATAGITAATFAHESVGNPLKIIGGALRQLDRQAKSTVNSRNYSENWKPPLDASKSAVSSLRVLGTAILNLLDRGKRRRQRVNLDVAVQSSASLYGAFIRGRNTKIQYELNSPELFILASPAAIESIATNFINNALDAMRSTQRSDRRLLLRTTSFDGNWRLEVHDAGPGVKDISPTDLWLPGQTTKPNGTGLGLAIVRDTVVELGGRHGVEDSGLLGGACFFVELPALTERGDS